MDQVWLRGVVPEDLPILYKQESDLVARRMAAFNTANFPTFAAFEAKWARMLSDPSTVNLTVMLENNVAGSVGSYLSMPNHERQVTYWIGREHWGKGIATQAVRLLLDLVKERPIFASCAADNVGSLRVLEKCGFRVTDRVKGFADGRGQVIVEVLHELR